MLCWNVLRKRGFQMPLSQQIEQDERRVPRLRTLSDTYAFIKDIDPDTAVTANAIRCLVVSGQVSSVKVGKKYLVDVDHLMDYLRGVGTGSKPANSPLHSLDKSAYKNPYKKG